MSETEAATIDPAAVPAAIETTTETPSATETVETTPAAPSRPAGYDPIDPKTATPEQTQERINYIYSQLKPTQRENREMRNLLAEQSKVIDQLSQNQQAVVTHLTQKSFADGKEQLKIAMQEAWKKQDNASYIDAQNKLMDLQVDERLQDKLNRQQPQQQTNGHIPRDAAEIARGAVQAGELNADEYRTTESWQSERDESGNIVRPWAFSTDPSYTAALFETRSVMANPRFANLPYAEKLAEVDRRMGVQKKTSSQSVMGGNLTKPAKSGKVELSPQERDIALRTKYAGKGKSEADHLEAYRKQVEKFKSTRRTA